MCEVQRQLRFPRSPQSIDHKYPRVLLIGGFASIVIVYLGVRNTGKTGEKSLRNCVERVASYLFHNLALTRGCTEAGDALHGSKIGYLEIFCENSLPTAA
jgi:hypothetical protein